MNALSLEAVCKSFGAVKAVDDLSVRVPKGSIYGFLGPNGAGKTTTIRMIMDIIRPDSGRIEILGDGAGKGVRDRIGYMPEERGLYRKMTVRDALAYFGAIKGMAKHELAEKVPRWLERLELDSWGKKRVEELSRGMHQKLQFAVTVVNEPELLILDEPFSGLDPINTDLLRDIIVEARDAGRTVIFSTHVMHQAEMLCDCILLINKGRAILDGRLAEIRSRHRSRAVLVELEGDTDYVGSVPGVTAVSPDGPRLQLTLTEDADPQQVLRTLLGRSRVLSFEVKAPSLHEIFVKLVSESDGQNS